MTSTAIRKRADRLYSLDTRHLYTMWYKFKAARISNENVPIYDEHYLTVMERERLIDILFVRLKNAEESLWKNEHDDDSADNGSTF